MWRQIAIGGRLKVSPGGALRLRDAEHFGQSDLSDGHVEFRQDIMAVTVLLTGPCYLVVS
jgi:hypothetical protein